jgi:2-dehydropantoate 2-reductase
MANVLIYGAGAIGSLAGYLLSESKNSEDGKIENVALLGRKSHMNKIGENGLRINGVSGSFWFENFFSSLDELKRSSFVPELVIVCVKTYSLPGVCDELKKSSLLRGKLKNASFLLLMNGMGNREVFDSLGLSSSQVFEGITSSGVKFSEDGLIELKGKGKTIFEQGIGEGIREFLKERFEEKGFEIEFASDFKKHQWNKLFVNAVINPITALTGKKNAIVLSQPLQSTVGSIIEECVSVAKEEGVEADRERVLELVHSVAAKTSMNTCSMLQDASKGKTTEIDSINGYVIRLAGKHGISVPVNETLYALVKSIESRCANKTLVL